MHVDLRRLATRAAALALSLVALACSDSLISPNGKVRPGAASRVIALPAGTLTWINPHGTGAANPSTFDPAGADRVEIREDDTKKGSGTLVASFTLAGGSLVANTVVGEFEATWDFSDIHGNKSYRISAFRGETTLGSVVVDKDDLQAIRKDKEARDRSNPANGPGNSGKLQSLDIQFHVAKIPLASIVFNEIESNGGFPDDWFELYNTGTTTVDLSGFSFLDGDNTHSPFVIPSGTTLAPGAYIVFDNAVDPAKPNAPIFAWGLGAPETVRIWDQYGRLLDSLSWTAHSPTTLGRCPNATGGFIPTTSSTKGAENDCSAPIKINEVESNGGDPVDWIELYNPSALTIDISGFVLKDSDDGHAFTIPAGTTIASHAFLAFDVDVSGGFGLGAADAARLYDKTGKLLDSYAWTAHAATTYGRCPDGTGNFVTTARATKAAANDCSSPIPVRINEVESNGGTPVDWIELYNTGTSAVDLSGFVLKDNDDGHAFTIPAGTSIPSHGYLAFDVDVSGGFGLGGADQARLFTPNSAALVDSYEWSAHATTTYGRCPDGTGAFVTTVASTKGAANSCPVQVVAAPWPGGQDLVTVDALNQWTSNLSGLVYEVGNASSPDVLWAALNGPGSIFRLVFDGSSQTWLPDANNGWAAGKRLHYTDGTGEPDSEDLTFTTGSSAGMYVATERNNQNSGVSHPAILRFDVTGTTTEINATHEWNLTNSLPVVGANLGIEAITWVPDAFLTAHNFFDSSKGHAYNPAEYADHGGGLFFIGIEGNGMVYVYALNHSNTADFTQVASISTGFPAGVMALQFDRELGYLWATCDDTCGGLADIFEIDQATGLLKITHIFNRPASMPNINNEGFAFTSNALCVGGLKPAFWSDDSNTGGHSLRRGSIPCSAFP